MREATTEELLERIKELEENEQVLNDAHCKLMDKLEEKDARIKELEEQLAHSNMYALINQLHKIIWKNEERIKELRYNLAMAKAYWWKYTYTNYDTYGFWLKGFKKKVTKKYYKKYREQWLRIAEALEARAAKILEGK